MDQDGLDKINRTKDRSLASSHLSYIETIEALKTLTSWQRYFPEFSILLLCKGQDLLRSGRRRHVSNQPYYGMKLSILEKGNKCHRLG